jgi:5S rRNA maturation endonuclease (ribonuclease M5)
MANGTAKRVLAGDRTDWSGLLIVVEGEPDFLWVATRTRLEHAVVGIYSGAWGNNDIGRAFASRWKGARVVLATDADAAGDRYAEAIARTLPRTCRIQRRRETFA